MAKHYYSGILRVDESVIAMPLGIKKRECFLKVLPSPSDLSEMKKGDLHPNVTSHGQPSIWEALRKAQNFLSDLPSLAELCPQYVKCPKSPENFRQIRRLSPLLT